MFFLISLTLSYLRYQFFVVADRLSPGDAFPTLSQPVTGFVSWRMGDSLLVDILRGPCLYLHIIIKMWDFQVCPLYV